MSAVIEGAGGIVVGWKGYAAVGAVCLALGFGGAWKLQTWRLGAQLSELKATQAKAAQEATAHVLSTQNGIQALFDQKTAEHQKEMDDAQRTFDARIAAIGNHAVRLSIPAICPAGVSNGTDTSLGNSEARAELDPAAGQALTAIAHDGDDAIRDLNECVDKYGAARLKLQTAGVSSVD